MARASRQAGFARNGVTFTLPGSAFPHARRWFAYREAARVLDHLLERFEIRMAQVGPFRCAGLRVRFTEVIGFSPRVERRA